MEDQARRREQFEKAHPDWQIWFEADRSEWHAENAEALEELHDFRELALLLDELEKRVRA
jgi:hypothetical protein